jgi:hypothetical protein
VIDLVDFKVKLAAGILAEDSTAAVHFGRSHLKRHDNQGPGTANRVIVAHGGPNGEWGYIRVGNKVQPVTKPSEAIHGELLTLDVWGYDSTGPADEEKQYRAMRALWQCVLRNAARLIREGGHTSTLWDAEPVLDDEPVDRRHGERTRLVFAIDFSVNAPTPASLVIAEAAPPEALTET